jgi:hypothetical protein
MYIIKNDHLPKDEIVSHLYVAPNYVFYYIVDSPTCYKIYEMDMGDFIQELKAKVQVGHSVKKMDTEAIQSEVDIELEEKCKAQDEPIAKIMKVRKRGKEKLDNLYSIFVRPSSDKELLSGNNERMVFINSNFTLYKVNTKNQNDLTKIQKAYKFRQVSNNLCAYRPIDEQTDKEMNQINFLNI